MTAVLRACFLGVLFALAFLAAGLVVGLLVAYWHVVFPLALAALCLFAIVCLTFWSD